VDLKTVRFNSLYSQPHNADTHTHTHTQTHTQTHTTKPPAAHSLPQTHSKLFPMQHTKCAIVLK